MDGRNQSATVYSFPILSLVSYHPFVSSSLKETVGTKELLPAIKKELQIFTVITASTFLLSQNPTCPPVIKKKKKRKKNSEDYLGMNYSK